MLYINVGADALIGPMAGLFGEQALQHGLTEYLRLLGYKKNDVNRLQPLNLEP